MIFKNIGTGILSCNHLGKGLVRPGEVVELSDVEFEKFPIHNKKFLSKDLNAKVGVVPKPLLEVTSFPVKGSMDEMEMPVVPQNVHITDELIAPKSVTSTVEDIQEKVAARARGIGDSVSLEGVISLDKDTDIDALEGDEKDLYANTGHNPEKPESMDAIDADTVIANAVQAQMGKTMVKGENGYEMKPVGEAMEQQMQDGFNELANTLNSEFKVSVSDTEINSIKQEIMATGDKGYLQLLINKNPDERVQTLAKQKLAELV